MISERKKQKDLDIYYAYTELVNSGISIEDAKKEVAERFYCTSVTVYLTVRRVRERSELYGV